MQSSTQLNTSQQQKPRKIIGKIIFLTVTLFLILFAWSNTQYIEDSISFWSYKPTSDVAVIAQKTTLTDNGKFLFYASQPSLDGSAAFNSECSRKEESTAILGCYSNNKIYIYDVSDTRLDGIKEVTAAHEMLHAVYQRMSPDEKQKINVLVEDEYEKLKSDPNYAERMAFYDRTEPGERDNELHSIIGTEVANISPALEKHYARYFKNRKVVTDLYQSYNTTFTALESQAEKLGAQLKDITKQIEELSASYNSSIKDLNGDIANFNLRAADGGFTSQAQFNSERAVLVTRSASLANQKTAINALVTQYNTLKDEYNNTVTQSNELYKSIDSTLAPAPSV